MAEGELEAEPHWVGTCGCTACACRSWLSYTWPGDAPTATLKIATYGGVVSGGGEPDRAYDPAVREADFARALSLVPNVFLRAVGYAAREIAPPKRVLEGDAVRFAIRRSDREVVRFLERKWSAHWYPARVERMHENPDETTFETLSWLLDQVAREMAAQMGQEVRPGKLRAKRAAVEPEPPAFDEAPALRR
jgi:hypothetical protein